MFFVKSSIMKHYSSFLVLFLLLFSCMKKNNYSTSENRNFAAPQKEDKPAVTLVIHGGAGAISRVNMTPEMEEAYHEKLREALVSGYGILEKGGTSNEAIIEAIKLLEDSPLFNAGKGSVFTNDLRNELDASIMDGSNLMAGAVAGVTTIRNPIVAAFAVMTKSKHVMLVGEGAEKFAQEHKLDMVDPSYFFDSSRYEQILRIREKESMSMPRGAIDKTDKFGTVGAVALDRYGNISAGTSTGGMTNKKYGRVGDSPIIGAGTYANNNTCAVSCTGHGEFFMRGVVAYDISALMEYGGLSLSEAADSVIMKKLVRQGGEGGMIGIDGHGNIAMVFNSEGMYRGFINRKGEPQTFIYK